MPAFIVEGRAEQKIVQRLCPSAKVMILECNGDHVELGAIAKKIHSLTQTCGNRHHPIVVQLDRERRATSAQEIEALLLLELASLGLDVRQFRIGITDRDLESWILYGTDEDGMFLRDCRASVPNEYEGSAGAYVLGTRLARRGGSYHKTTVGVDMFCRLSAVALAAKSESFRRFLAQLDVDCYWKTV